MPILKNYLTIEDLPTPPPHKTGWPWTENSHKISNYTLDKFPLISIVTPNYNQGEFIEETIRSVLLQGYPNLEYIIIDGGSTDNSVEIIKKYQQFLAYWVSEKDQGQSDGINKGLKLCTGDYVAWMNADDCYLANYLTTIFVEKKGYLFDFIYGNTFCGTSLETKFFRDRQETKNFKLENLLLAFKGEKFVIPSQSVFVSKQLMKKVGFLADDLYYCMDMDWFMRMSLEKPNTLRLNEPMTFYRTHAQAKTCINTNNGNREEAINLAKKYLPHLSKKEQIKLTKTINFNNEFVLYKQNKKPKSLVNFISTILKYPYNSLSDTVFLGMIKNTLLSR